MNLKKMLAIAIPAALTILIIIVLINNKTKLDAGATLTQTAREIPVVVTTPQWITASETFTYSGTVKSQQQINVMPKTQGTVIAKYKHPGDRVKAGDPIAKIEDNLIRENLRIAELNYRKAEADVKRYQNLLNQNVISKSELEAVEISRRSAENVLLNLREELKHTLITATADGILEKDYYETGSYVASGTVMAEIIDPRNLKAVIHVIEKDAARIRKQDIAIIESTIHPDKTFGGSVHTVGTQGNAVMAYTVEIRFDKDYSQELKPGMYVNVTVNSRPDSSRQHLAIDRSCIAGSLKNPNIFIVKDGKAYQRQITAGEIIGDKITVLHGLTESDTIVRSGQINLEEGTPVQILK